MNPLPTFRLRCDWPFEVGFIDRLRQPLTPEQYAREVLQPGETLSLEDVAHYNQWRAGYQPPDYFIYASWVRANQRDPSRLIWDGHRGGVVTCPGLWADLIGRARAACAADPVLFDGLFPLRFDEPANQQVRPQQVILHRLEAGIASVVPYAAAAELVKKTARWSGRRCGAGLSDAGEHPSAARNRPAISGSPPPGEFPPAG